MDYADDDAAAATRPLLYDDTTTSDGGSLSRRNPPLTSSSTALANDDVPTAAPNSIVLTPTPTPAEWPAANDIETPRQELFEPFSPMLAGAAAGYNGVGGYSINDGGDDSRIAQYPATTTGGAPLQLPPVSAGRPGLAMLQQPQQRQAVAHSLPGPKPRLLYEQRRLRIWLPVITLLVFCLGLLTVGCLLIFPDTLPVATWFGFVDDQTAVIVGYSTIAISIILPLLSLLISILLATPSRGQRERRGVYADALLEEMISSSGITEHITEAGNSHAHLHGSNSDDHHLAGSSDNARNGTIILLAGAGAPRQVMHQLLPLLSHRIVGYQCAAVDLPSHGSLASVAFSLSRCERVISAVIERELSFSKAAWAANPSSNNGSGNGNGNGEAHHHHHHHQYGTVLGSNSTAPGASASAAAASSTSVASSPPPIQTRAVVLVAYGASAHVASYYASRHPGSVAGVVCIGSIPNYASRSLWNRIVSALLRVRWAASVQNLNIKARVVASKAGSDDHKSALLSHDWHTGVVPEYCRECRYESYTNAWADPRPPQVAVTLPAISTGSAANQYADDIQGSGRPGGAAVTSDGPSLAAAAASGNGAAARPVSTHAFTTALLSGGGDDEAVGFNSNNAERNGGGNGGNTTAASSTSPSSAPAPPATVPLLSRFRLLRRPILFLVSQQWMQNKRSGALQLIRGGPSGQASSSLSAASPLLTFETVRGVKHDRLPTLNPAKIEVIATSILAFAKRAYQFSSIIIPSEDEAMQQYIKAQQQQQLQQQQQQRMQTAGNRQQYQRKGSSNAGSSTGGGGMFSGFGLGSGGGGGNKRGSSAGSSFLFGRLSQSQYSQYSESQSRSQSQGRHYSQSQSQSQSQSPASGFETSTNNANNTLYNNNNRSESQSLSFSQGTGTGQGAAGSYMYASNTGASPYPYSDGGSGKHQAAHNSTSASRPLSPLSPSQSPGPGTGAGQASTSPGHQYSQYQQRGPGHRGSSLSSGR